MEPRIPHGWATMIGDLVRVRPPEQPQGHHDLQGLQGLRVQRIQSHRSLHQVWEACKRVWCGQIHGLVVRHVPSISIM